MVHVKVCFRPKSFIFTKQKNIFIHMTVEITTKYTYIKSKLVLSVGRGLQNVMRVRLKYGK